MSGRRNRGAHVSVLSSVIAGICLTLFIFSGAVVLILNSRWLYYLDISLLNLDRASGMSVADIKANYDTLIRYNQLWYRGDLAFPTLVMSTTGHIHFQEVKRIFDGVQILCIVTGLISLISAIRMHHRSRRWLRIAGVLSLIIPAALGLLALWNWDAFFTGFHHLFFRNDYWLFDPVTDPVINILPDTYFLHCVIGILAVIVLCAILCLARAGRSRARH